MEKRTWQGFVTESKQYMNHPDCWQEHNWKGYTAGGWCMCEKRAAALKFWLAFPRAWLRFAWFTVRDWFRGYWFSVCDWLRGLTSR